MFTERVLCRDLPQQLHKRVVLAGWVQQVRQVGRRLAFWIVRDRSGWAQVVVSGEPALTAPAPESVVWVQGEVVPSQSQQGLELQAKAVQVLSGASELPFAIHHPNLNTKPELLLNQRVLSLRHQQNQAVFRVKAVIAQAFRAALVAAGFLEVQTPKIVATGTEGGAELFAVQYFEQPAYLAQSPQFYKQMLVSAGFERVFEVGPAFRAEEHNTSRHINEFTSLDLEMGFIESENELMQLETELLRQIFQAVRERCPAELALLQATVPELQPDYTIPQLPLANARSILQQEYGHTAPAHDLDPQGERLLCQYAQQTWGQPLVFVTHYPPAARPFYTRTYDDGSGLTRSFDLLWRGLEITTGGLRIHQHDELVQSMRQHGLQPADYEFYLQAFALGMPPHGGLAIGLERLTAQLLNLNNIRQATLFPRDRQRLVP